MPRFFIDRPVFAWVIAIAIVLMGVIAIPQMPVARFPNVAPPTVSIYASYPGATPQTLNDSVVSLVQRELSSVKNLLYFESSADTSGSATITATFRPGTDPELAQVDVQNRLKTIEPRLPQVVRQTGVTVESAASGFLMIVSLLSDGRQDEVELSDYMTRNIVDELKRVPGVGRVQNFSAERAMRIWIDPAKLAGFGLTATDVTAAIAEQNVQIAPGALGAEPTTAGQRVLVPLTADGQLKTPEDFAAIILKADTDGSSVTLDKVARIELGRQSFGNATRENGKVAASVGIQLTPGANAVAASSAVRERMTELSRALPQGMSWTAPFDTAPFVRISIEKVLHTLAEAMVLVFLVMYLFLQKVRYTLIPAIVAPIALLGTIAVMLATGYSINVLTMFGMVLAIGIIVDDAIVVVENVERLMHEEQLSPRDATRKAMEEITPAIIGITLVLSAVFIPMAMATGSVGTIYRQFSMAMAVSILFSALLALTLTPALCATLLKPLEDAPRKNRFFTWFDDRFDRLTQRYQGWIARLLKASGRMMLAFIAIVGMLGLAFATLPSSFMPEEDQGYFMTSFQLPADATATRTLDAVQAYERHAATRPGIDTTEAILGFGFSGSGPNAAMVFTMLKDWGDRRGTNVAKEVAAAETAMAGAIHEGQVMSVTPPAIDELGTSSGFALRLEDRAGKGREALFVARDLLIAHAARNARLSGVYAEGLPAGTSVRLNIDRAKARALGVSFTAISDMIGTALGSSYVNDFPNQGRLQQVIVQAEPAHRMHLDDVMRLRVRNAAGGTVPLAELVTPVWSNSPLQLASYNGYPSVSITGTAAPGTSSGDAMREMERLAADLPTGFAIEWTGQSLQERNAGAQAPMLLALSMLVVFLVLAALYESWSIPMAVLLVVPLGLIGAVAAVLLRDLSNDVFFKVGLVTIIGLSAKNAILIVEFARQYREAGSSLVEAAIAAARVRLRPIVMTSLAFTLGVMPLMLAGGASAETQHAIGTGVFGGMITGTLLALVFVPTFFVVVVGMAERWRTRRAGKAA
ncbi:MULTISPECIES: multidrug efflux RND transporter permease subunit [unclassified Sphingomonas]|uniref:multidrug efflux RND transporter permease subunit n=1 Tax=unclassified Sphingomonas TaxID=196159 RepID=UPI0006F64FCB|nr:MULTISPECIES: multidrug efflux RND transporter permease subunit [unclassified Sphingomonas]KQM23925.1 acriflavine resistance protein B [Sphingomonas sp. Leaf9]KQM42053.1 acriflavine resistance protein B [Sphingomonas sp. Leaf11]